MKALKLILALIAITAIGLGLGILTGCTSAAPLDAAYIDDDGNTVATITIDTNGTHIIYNDRTNTNTNTPLYPVSGSAAGLTKVDPRAYKGWPGKCPGCDIDAWIMQCLITSYDNPCSAIYNEQATLPGIIAAADQALNRLATDGLLFLSISGHGSHTRDLNSDEISGQDQQLCLWNTRLTDDDVWLLLNRIRTKRPDVRILMISDTCHSGSNYRGERPLALAPGLSKRASTGSAEPNLLHFGGCSDSSYSYGSSQGGVFTTALIDAFDLSLTYAQWFAAAAALMPANQPPVIEHTGTYFGDRLIFK